MKVSFTTTNWFQFLQISHLRLPPKSVPERRVALRVEARCELAKDVREAPQQVGVARSGAVDVYRENFDEVAS